MTLTKVGDNITLTLNEIKIKDYKLWQPVNECSLLD